MDGNQFDLIARGLAGAAPRRRLLGGLLGITLAAVSGAPTFAAKRRKRKGHDGKDGDETAESDLPPGALTGGLWDETIDMCHFDPEAGAYTVLAIPTTSVPDYLAQGDNLYIDCCDTSECGALPCFTPSGCISGACMYDPVPGQGCALSDGTTGVCNDDGECVGSVASGTSMTG